MEIGSAFETFLVPSYICAPVCIDNTPLDQKAQLAVGVGGAENAISFDATVETARTIVLLMYFFEIACETQTHLASFLRLSILRTLSLLLALALRLAVLASGVGVHGGLARAGAGHAGHAHALEHGLHLGLGLALVSKIISENGGWIGVESTPGRTAFRISLPVVPRDRPTNTETR